MTSKLLQDTGEALYGAQWQSAIARDLDISDRHMRRLASGEAELRPGMITDLLRIASARAADLGAVIDKLRIASAAES